MRNKLMENKNMIYINASRAFGVGLLVVEELLLFLIMVVVKVEIKSSGSGQTTRLLCTTRTKYK